MAHRNCLNYIPITQNYQIIIIGGGLAGLANTLEFARAGFSVLLLEKKSFPRHKVCGEYLPNEVRPYLQSLGADLMELKPKKIERLHLTALNGKRAECRMQMGGLGLSRFALDDFLYQKALEAGAKILCNTTCHSINFQADTFAVKTSDGQGFKASVVIGAQGKRSNLDQVLNRRFMKSRSSYIGVKHHFEAQFPNDLVALHNFSGGYAGLSRVENNHVNLCYLTTTAVFKSYAGIAEMEEKHLGQNPFLKEFLDTAQPVFAKPLVISQINFAPKPLVENHILMCGDAAGLIHPLCGNGMAMAIHSAGLARKPVSGFLNGELSREQMERAYSQSWQRHFGRRLKFGRQVQNLFGRNTLSNWAVSRARAFPGLLRKAVSYSHGSEITHQ